MAMGSWAVSAIVRFSGNGGTYMARLAASTRNANTALNRQLGLVSKNDAALARYKARMAEIAAAQNAFVTKASFGVAAVGVTALGYAVTQAANLQRAMTGVQIATAASADEYQRLRAMVFNVSGMTAQSAVTIAKEMQVAATSGLNDPAQLRKAFPQIAMLADVMWINKGVNPLSTVKYATQFAHYFGAYSGKPLQAMLDDVARLEMMQPEGMERLVQQGKYFIPFAARMGMDEHTIMRYMALMGQTGLLTGRGGTGMGQVLYHALNTAALTGHLSKAQFKGLTDLGLLDSRGKLASEFLTKTGAPDVDKLMASLIASRVAFGHERGLRGPSDWAADVKNAFGVQGTQIVGIIASTISQERMKQIDSQMTKIPGVEGQWKKYFDDFFFQVNRFKTNLQNVATSLGLPTLPKLTAWFRDMADRIGRFDDFLNAHPDIAGKISAIAAGFTALFAARAGMGVLIMMFNAAKALSLVGGAGVAAAELGTMAKAIRALDIILLGGIGTRILTLTKVGAALQVFSAMVGATNAAAVAASLGALRVAIVAFAGSIWAANLGSVGAALGTLRTAIVTFAAMMGGTTVVAAAPALRALGTAIAALAAAPFAVAVAGLGALLTAILAFPTPAGSDEFKIRQGKGYGSLSFWQGYTKAHGLTSVPATVRHEIGDKLLLAPPKAPPPPKGHGGKHAAAGGHVTHIGKVEIRVDGSKDPHATGQAVKVALESLVRNPRSLMGSAAATLRTHPNVPTPLSVGFA